MPSEEVTPHEAVVEALASFVDDNPAEETEDIPFDDIASAVIEALREGAAQRLTALVVDEGASYDMMKLIEAILGPKAE